MARLHQALALLCAAALPVALGGCVGAVVVGGLAAAGGGGYLAGQERGLDGTVSDLGLQDDIAKAFAQADPQLANGVTTTVYNRRALLTGRVTDPAMKSAAVEIASRVPYVRTVHDEIEVASAEGFWDGARDTWISTQVRSQMVVDPEIRSVNYEIGTQNGSVYLIGSARSQRELDRATQIARQVPGVKRVVSYVELRSGVPAAPVPVAAGTAGQPLPSYGIESSGASPRTRIEVQKL